jgi:hypothetical protein
LKTISFKNALLKGKKRAIFADATPILLLKLKEVPQLTKSKKTKRVEKAQVQVPEDLINRCHAAFNILKDRLYIALTLMFPNFEAPFLLYIDGSKEFGYGYAVY